MKPTTRRIILNWIVGAIAGTAVIAVSSPLFIRSYLPLRADNMRGVWTLPEGTRYRWRSEGYADSVIGPFGMPGKATVRKNTNGEVDRVALWGDSQAEGVCVDDREKLFSQAERLAGGRLEVFPFARSGEDAADWVTQMPRVENELGIDLHVFLVVDLPDIVEAVKAPVAPPDPSDIAAARSAIAARVPAFVVQAGRHVLTEADGTTRRQLRFSIGPPGKTPAGAVTGTAKPRVDWLASLKTIAQASQRPVVILYAPMSPQIIRGKVIMDDDSSDEFAELQTAAESVGIAVVDARDSLRQSALAGDWPHGFHNGLIGSGHLNADGYAVVAAELVAAADELLEQGN